MTKERRKQLLREGKDSAANGRYRFCPYRNRDEKKVWELGYDKYARGQAK